MDTKTRFNANYDTGWTDSPTSIHRRGIHDYVRYIGFNSEPSESMLKELVDFLLENDCPGWTGIRATKIVHLGTANFEYKFTTTWDSSD